MGLGSSYYTSPDGFVFYSNPIYKAKEYAPLKEEDVPRLKQLQNTNNFQVQQTQISQKNTGKQQGDLSKEEKSLTTNARIYKKFREKAFHPKS